MPALKPLIAPIRKYPWLSAVAALLLTIIIVVISARVWIASDGGRAWLLSQIDGRKAGAYGAIDAEGLSGDPLGKMYLRRLAVRDANGDWVVAQNISVDWAPMALVFRPRRCEGPVGRRTQLHPPPGDGEAAAIEWR
jgi:translocation and assembly module TamB